MPLMKLCARHGLVPPTGCQECAKERKARSRVRQQNDNRDRAWWRRIRKQVLARDHHRCLRCGADGPLTAHFLPGGPHTRHLDDYETLCRSCHGREHAGWGQQRREDLEDVVT
jgi:5-methylcytosine-specific restriction endonuclease McrA